ncbi:hypothetical protein SAMN05216251_111185 [Actinacidiphila alni]|uniref:CPBP family intramembrane metalloprotease n=1 Tax=Actinacidiphila alni TaxID=380248 RepID=A0A1I2HUZ5_9ACTN|nr:hypothetical protein [Actinacidiphila alni]SFF32191.1 hypothetical protein SAMN05216251_111185 [Actinacidiphila alni]
MPYPLVLALTLLVEVPCYVAAVTAAAPAPVRPRRTALAAVMVNCVTHPPLWWFLRQAHGAAYWPAFAVAEAAVCAVEGLLLGRLLRLRGQLPYAASVAANCASVIAGLLVLG